MLCKTSLVWLRFGRRKTYPWITLVIASYKIACFGEVERDREKARLMMALAKINFVGVLELLNDLLW